MDRFDWLIDFGKPKKVVPVLFKIETIARDLIKLQPKIANCDRPYITIIGFRPPEKLLSLVLKLRHAEMLGQSLSVGFLVDGIVAADRLVHHATFPIIAILLSHFQFV